MSNTLGDFKNIAFEPLLTAIPCLKNRIMFFTCIASLSSLGDILNVNPNGRSEGPLNNNSKFGLRTAPVALESKP